jgi:hypothetical protein
VAAAVLVDTAVGVALEALEPRQHFQSALHLL